MREQGLEAAKRFVHDTFPNCSFAILAGSASRGEETPTSDLDIVIFQETPGSYRESFYFYNWRIEVFVHDFESYLEEFENEKRKGRPVLGSMIVEGKVIKSSNQYKLVKEHALLHVTNGPVPLTAEFITSSRYYIYDLLDDFTDSTNYEEALITLNTLSLQVADFILRYNQRWSGRGKNLTKALRSFDHQVYEDFFSSMNSFYWNNDKLPFIQFANQVYEPVGGLLFEGFLQKGKGSGRVL
ncbi:nucleotidyltransferase domain-containing protein [Peribacillus sp. SCS-37]|uniref:nucleotidyltransferase domain-containing protein n=1 Tax=Paraperibacillus esterisolvens TaxID=3115296 RepID=UPI003905F39C